ncbi:MAG: DUF4974 domain-containing protein [Bacteroidales bacterium]|nr:DUF4974 domain-containing protein [Bacteroidales bacterium]
MEREFTKYTGLIDRYLSGKLIDDEYKQLTDFIKQSYRNKDYFIARTNEWIPPQDAVVDKSWRLLYCKLTRGEQLNRSFRGRFRLPKTFLRIAALFILALACGALLSIIVLNKTVQNDNPIVFNAPKGEKSMICLSDSTRIWLNGGSLIEVRKDYGFTNRIIALNGEAYFEVTSNKRIPFIVESGQFQTKVLGTKFSVEAYSNQNYIKTTVVEGRVQIESAQDDFRPLVLNKKECAIYNKNTGHIELIQSKDVLAAISWTQNKLIFENEHYLTVLRKLENWYGVEFKIEGELNYEPYYTMTIKTETLRELLDLIYFITPLEYQINGDKVTLRFKSKK